MKRIRSLIPLLLLLEFPVHAQSFSTLFTFNAGSSGENPSGPLLQGPGGVLYGETFDGGTNGNGTLFAINSSGSGFNVLYTFSANGEGYTNIDGADPAGGLILSGDTVYGTAIYGGAIWGTVFSFNIGTKEFTTLYIFDGDNPQDDADGTLPQGGLRLSGNTLYGTAAGSGLADEGSVFSIDIGSDTFSALHSFSSISSGVTNYDGAQPTGALLLSDNTLYGAASDGGLNGAGTLFSINLAGNVFNNFYSFTSCSNNGAVYIGKNRDGAGPLAGLILSGNTLYGTAYGGGTNAVGTVFSFGMDGSGFTTLHNFTDGSDGARPNCTLLLSGDSLYGTTQYGGADGYGTVFSVKTDGSGFTTLHSFTGGSDGSFPNSGLILSSGVLYGTANDGGTNGCGTIFSISLSTPPQLTIQRLGNHPVLAWSDVDTGYTLKSTTNLVSPVTWTIVTPAPVVVNGQFTVTNLISGKQVFYQLSQ